MFAKYPKTLLLLSLGEFWERLSFFGTLILLILYTHKIFGLSDVQSFAVYGVFVSLSFALPVLGGLLTDKFLGIRRAILFGLLLLITGNILLITSHLWSFYIGLAMLNLGTGLYKPACTASVGKLYQPEDPMRERAYTFFYVTMNIGATLGPVFYGLMMEFFGWHSGFLMASISLSIVALLFLFMFKESNFIRPVEMTTKNSYKNLILASIFLATLFVSFLFDHQKITQIIFVVFAISIILGFVIYAYKQDRATKYNLYGLGLIFCFSMFFFVASLQVGSTINLFILRDINRDLLGWQVPAIVFGTLDPLFVVLLAPVFISLWQFLAKRNREPKVVIKLAWGLIFAILGLGCFILAGKFTELVSAPYWALFFIILGYIGLGAGEICLVPAVFNAASRYAPKNLASSLTGLMFLFVAFGGYLGSLLANFSDQTLTTGAVMTKIQSITIYSDTFMIISAVILVAVIMLFIFYNKIQKLLDAK